jgi:hypothetical protein
MWKPSSFLLEPNDSPNVVLRTRIRMPVLEADPSGHFLPCGALRMCELEVYAQRRNNLDRLGRTRVFGL